MAKERGKQTSMHCEVGNIVFWKVEHWSRQQSHLGVGSESTFVSYMAWRIIVLYLLHCIALRCIFREDGRVWFSIELTTPILDVGIGRLEIEHWTLELELLDWTATRIAGYYQRMMIGTDQAISGLISDLVWLFQSINQFSSAQLSLASMT